MRTLAAFFVAAALALPAAALAHIGVTPSLVAAGETARLSLDVPNERPGPAMTSFVVRVPAGARVVSAEPAPGWAASASAQEAVWRGSLASGQEVALAFELEAPAEPGAVDLKAVQHYADGGTVPWTIRVTIGPAASAPAMRLGRALVTGIVGLGVIGGALFLLRRRRASAAR